MIITLSFMIAPLILVLRLAGLFAIYSSLQLSSVSWIGRVLQPSDLIPVRKNLKMLTVSVIIPNYNHARYLRKRIESVLEQTYQDFEVILLDDCSTDESRSILSEYAGDARVRID